VDIHNVWVLALVTLALTIPGKDATSNDNDYQRFENHIVATSKGENEVLAECLTTSTAGNSQGIRPTVYMSRVLCNSSSGSFVTLVRLETDTDHHDLAIVDLGSGEWLKISLIPEFEPRGEDESRDDWYTRITEAQRTGYVVGVESSSRLFETVDKEVVDSWRPSVWIGLEESDPDLAIRVRWILENLGNAKRPYFRELITTLRTYVYDGPEPDALDIIEDITFLGTYPSDEPAMPDFEADFGKWASFPDWPRVLDK